MTALAVITLACSLELAIGEPRTRLHPVAWFGRVVGLVDREWTLDASVQRALGYLVALVLPLAAAAVVGAFVLVVGTVHPVATPIAAGVVLFLTSSLRALLDLTESVVAATGDDVEAARDSVRGLVGRDTTDLSPAQLRSAAVESAAENLVDGYVATLVPFALLAPVSLPIAAAVATWVKAVNTLDSMLGYPHKPIGTASARLDDAVMWIPARLTAVLLAIASVRPRAIVRARRWARTPSSPNSGWPMATVACVLDVRLEKPGAYILNPDATLPNVEAGDRAVRLVGLAAVLAVVVAAIGVTVVSASFDTFDAGQSAVLVTMVDTGSRIVPAVTPWEVLP